MGERISTVFSSYFFDDKYINYKFDFIKRKLSQLYKPFIVYGLIFLLLSKLFYFLKIIDYRYTINEFVNRFIEISIFKDTEILLAPFWFLRSLFIVSIFFLIIRFLTSFFNKQDFISNIIILIIFIIGILLSYNKIYLPCQLQREFIVLLFYALGFFFHKYNIPLFLNKIVYIFSLIVLILLATVTKVDLLSSYFNNFYYFIIGSLIGILFIISSSKFLSKLNISKLFSFTGKKTIPILALHFLSFKIVNLLIIYIERLPIYSLSDIPIIKDRTNYNYWILYSLVGVIVPLFLNQIFSHFIKEN